MKTYLKRIVTLLIAAVSILVIFITTQIPVTNTKINDLPLVVVNQDKTEMSNAFVNKLKETTTLNDKISVKWTEVDSKDEAISKMNDGEYYGALIIPENYAKSVATLATPTPNQAEFEVVINQGKNPQLSTQVTQLLTTVANTSGQAASKQIILRAEAANQPLPAKVVDNLLSPVKVNVENINTTGDFVNAQGVFFYTVWMTSLISAIVLYIIRRQDEKTTKEKVTNKAIQFGVIGTLSLIIGYLAPYLVEKILNVTIDNYAVVGGFLSLCMFAFITLILGFVSLGGMAVAPIFGLLLFFGLPTLSVAPEMLSSFYLDYVLPWLPMRFLYDGVKNIMFFGQGFWNGATNGLVTISVIGVALMLLSIYKKEKVKKEA